MIYAYDQYTPLPVLSIYDTQMMLASVGAAKDMYEKGLQEMKDFKNEYGNFMSPIAKDMEWYNKNVTGKVRDAINMMYANGIDPIRSAEGRAALSRIINSIDPAAVNFRKLRAANALAMQKNIDDLKAKGLYNEAFSKSLGEDPNDWAEDFVGTTSPTPYMDYKNKYGHLFKDMDYEYDPEASKLHPGMDVFTKNKGRMHDILSMNRPDLTNDKQYAYDLLNIASKIAEANPNMSQEDVIKQATSTLEKEIVERNYSGGMKMQANPIYMKELDDKYDAKRQWRSYNYLKKIMGDRQNGKEPKKQPLGMLSGMMNSGVSLLSGTTNPTLLGRHLKINVRNVFNTAFEAAGLNKKGTGRDGLPLYNTKDFNKSSRGFNEMKQMYKQKFGFIVSAQDFPEYIKGTAISGSEAFGITQLSRNDLSKLYGENDVITHSYGYQGTVYSTKPIRDHISKKLKDGANYSIIPSDFMLPVFNRKTAQIEYYQKINAKEENGDGKNDFTLYRKIDAMTSGKNDSGINKNPITNFDVDEHNINLARSVSSNLDIKYKASQDKTVDTPYTGTWTGDYNDVDGSLQIDDSYFYNH